MITEIIQIIKNHDNCTIYPFYELSQNSCKESCDDAYIISLKQLKKYSKNIYKTCLKHYSTNVTETYFRDIIKSEVDNKITYFTKKTMMTIIDNIIVVKNIIKNISEEKFPNLIEYDHIKTKKLDIYEYNYFDVVINDMILYINTKSCEKISDKQLESELKQICGLLNIELDINSLTI